MAMSVRTRRRLRILGAVLVLTVLAVIAYQRRHSLMPALGRTAERVYDAADAVSDAEYGR